MNRLGEQYGFAVDWKEFKSSTSYTVSNRYPRVPRLSRLSLALMVCSPLTPLPPESVLTYEHPVRKRQNPVFTWIERTSLL